MCGRYAATANPDELIEEFDVDENHLAEPARSVLVNPQEPPPGTPDHNAAPSKQEPVVLTRSPRIDPTRESTPAAAPSGGGPVRQLRLLTWGLVPSWAGDERIGARMINARAESVVGSRAFGRAVRSRRCLVPAAGWYEWQASPTAVDTKGKPRKQPFFTHRADGDLTAFAGIYEFWRDPTAEDPEDPLAWLTSYAIITTAAEPGLDRIHDRQPLVLERGDWARWLDPDLDAVPDLLSFSSPGRFEAYPVTRAVNATRNNGPHLLDPAPADELDGVVDPMTGEIIGNAP